MQALSIDATPIDTYSDPAADSVATPIERTTMNTTAHQCSTTTTAAFQDDEMMFSERIVATLLKRRRNDMSFPSSHGTEQFHHQHRLQPQYKESDHYLSSLPPPSNCMTTKRTQLQAQLLPVHPLKEQPSLHPIKEEQPPPPPRARKVHFSSSITVTTIPSSFDLKTTCWYERKDYESFEMDCRQCILAFMSLRSSNAKEEATAPNRSVPQHPFGSAELMTNAEDPLSQPPMPECVAQRKTVYFTIHGLDDFTSVEAKFLRTRRRLEHCYNVLYHQWILRQILQQGRNGPIPKGNDAAHNDTGSGTVGSHCCTSAISTESAILLQRIAQLSSLESLRLALFRGQSYVATTVH